MHNKMDVLLFPAKKFLDICRSFASDMDIIVEFVEDRAIIRCGRSKFNLSTLPAEGVSKFVTNWASEVDFSIEQATLNA